jgi:hypothetical protein
MQSFISPLQGSGQGFLTEFLKKVTSVSVRILTLQHIIFKSLMMFNLESCVKRAVKFTVACKCYETKTHIGS